MTIASESMVHHPKLQRTRAGLLQHAACGLALLMICAPLTIGTVLAFPIWDDAWVWLLLKERGVGAIATSFADRPVNAGLWSLLAISEDAFWRAAFVAQSILWPILGVLAALIWNCLFPRLGRYAFLVACLTVAPIATKVQMVAANVALASLLSVVLAYGALFLLLRAVVDNRLGRTALIMGVPMLAFGVLIQEYALSVVMVAVALFSSYAWLTTETAVRKRALHAVLLVIFTAAVTYALYFLLADRDLRPNVHPLHAFTQVSSHFFSLPFQLMSAIWQGLVGSFGASLSTISLTTKSGVLGIVFGACVASLLVYGGKDLSPSFSSSKTTKMQGILLLLGALVVGLIPLVAMGRIPWDPRDGMSSRFGLPVLPVVSMLTVLTSLVLIRRRFWPVPVILFGLIAGNMALAEAWSAISERNAMAAYGKLLQPHVSSNGGYTVAVVSLPDRSLGPRRQWELTARLAASWPPSLRKTFWAYPFGGPPLQYTEDAKEIFGPRGKCKQPQEINRLVRQIERRGSLDLLLWVEPQANGSISVEPYCLGNHELNPVKRAAG